MYKIIGADGKEYGPVTLEQLRSWLAQGRLNPRTPMQPAGSSEWKPAGEVPDVATLFVTAPPAQPQGAPPILTAPNPAPPAKALAILSFVLGLLSFVLCLSVMTAVPAILCGHIARRRAARFPQRFGGVYWARAGLGLGYANLVLSLVVVASLVLATFRTRQSGETFSCQNNLRQIGLAFKVWALEHNDQYPFNVSTNAGGSRELCAVGPDGFDSNSLPHFRLIANDLNQPQFLVCPRDPAKHAAPDFASLQPANVSYLLRTGTNIDGDHPQEVLAVCPVHGTRLFCDGNVRPAPPPHR